MKKMYEEGGLATDGMDVDPVSGNDIPVGSNAEDVRDDVDAKLSSGEYVVPADVVKYLGVAQLEKLVNKAKDGLEDMEENGRIGGAPAEEPEEVVMTLGGDLETLDGYATGGLVPGADINGIIDRVKAAAMKDPSITNLLKSKGIFVQAPEQGQAAVAPAVEGQAAPRKFAEGGSVETPEFAKYDSEDYTSTFDPYAHGPGFSITTGASAAPVPPTCPEGYELDPTTNTCVPVEAKVEEPKQDEGPSQEELAEQQNDPNAWMEQYDYTNPETLMNQTMTTLGLREAEEEKEGAGGFMGKIGDFFSNTLGKTLAGGMLGKLMATNNYSSAMANAAVLEAQGYKAEAQSIRNAATGYAKDKGVRVGGFFDGTKGKSERAVGLMAGSFGKTGTSLARGGSGGSSGGPRTSGTGYDWQSYKAPGASKTFNQKSSPNAAKAAKSLRSRQSDAPSTEAMRGISRGADIAEEAASSGRSIADIGRSNAPSTAAPSAEDRSAAAAGASRGIGGEFGMAKGGLVQPRRKTPTSKKMTTKTTNKKGLGRR